MVSPQKLNPRSIIYYSLHPCQPTTNCSVNLLNLLKIFVLSSPNWSTKFTWIQFLTELLEPQGIIHVSAKKMLNFDSIPFQTSYGYHYKTKCLLSKPCSWYTVASSVTVSLLWCNKHFYQLKKKYKIKVEGFSKPPLLKHKVNTNWDCLGQLSVLDWWLQLHSNHQIAASSQRTTIKRRKKKRGRGA